ncbi:MAG: hypothetical protein GXP08_15090 [Gammaproteobacteria bacterium]|nr:hypothetical protein [Gammaproteobacteria bacterium]
MSLVGKLLVGDDIVKSVGDTLDGLSTSGAERLEAQLELAKAEYEHRYLEAKLLIDQNTAQAEINKTEIRSGHIFIAGWRPAIGWIGVIALFYQFVLYPLLLWLPIEEAPPQMEAEVLYTIITGMLGVAGMRSFDKLKKTDTKGVVLTKQ